QVVVAMDAAADRVLDRHDAVERRPRVDRVEDFLEAPTRHELRVGVDLARRGFAERSWFPLLRDFHISALNPKPAALSPKPCTAKKPSTFRLTALKTAGVEKPSAVAVGDRKHKNSNDDGNGDAHHVRAY